METRAWAGKRALSVLACLYMLDGDRTNQVYYNDDDTCPPLSPPIARFSEVGQLGDRVLGESRRMTNRASSLLLGDDML